MRYAVLDTNILVSALMRPEGPPGQVMAAVRRGDLRPVFSAAILTEYGTVLRRTKLRLDRAKVETALDALQTIGSLLHGELPPAAAGLPDPDDWPFIACALAAGCPVITGNARDFPPALGVRIMTAREWVDGKA